MLEHDIKKILVSHDEITEAAKKLTQLSGARQGEYQILNMERKLSIYMFFFVINGLLIINMENQVMFNLIFFIHTISNFICPSDTSYLHLSLKSTSFIKTFKIQNLFGYKDVEMSFEDSYKIIVGENGTGKTTILNCLYYTLSKRFELLSNIRFDSITINFTKNRKISTA